MILRSVKLCNHISLCHCKLNKEENSNCYVSQISERVHFKKMNVQHRSSIEADTLEFVHSGL